jgi:hypothetical protein
LLIRTLIRADVVSAYQVVWKAIVSSEVKKRLFGLLLDDGTRYSSSPLLQFPKRRQFSTYKIFDKVHWKMLFSADSHPNASDVYAVLVETTRMSSSLIA